MQMSDCSVQIFLSCFVGYAGKNCVTVLQDMPIAFFVNGSKRKSTNMAYKQFRMIQERNEILRKVGEQSIIKFWMAYKRLI